MASPLARPDVLALRSSEILLVANAALGRENVLPFWFGESDRATPAFIVAAATQALAEGRTFYTHNLGRPDLRAAPGDYLSALHGRRIGVNRLAVTNSGVSALMIACQAVVNPGDRVVALSPVWPNVVEIPKILGGHVFTAPLEFRAGRWRLDLQRLIDVVTPQTRALLLNSPNNPTGWTIDADDLAVVVSHCRRYGVWLIADDVYERLIFGDAPTAPSVLTHAEDEDRIISANSFSKTWGMTGWRLGWLTVPPALTASLGVLLEYNTSCAPDFIQSAGVAAVQRGEASVAALRTALKAARDQVLTALRGLPEVEAAEPDGGLYVFFRIKDDRPSVTIASDMIASVGLGLAPGSAFGVEGQGWLRWCFAAETDKNAEGLRRLGAYLA
jgi:aspartate/methionine/tyrosine aminotransferase